MTTRAEGESAPLLNKKASAGFLRGFLGGDDETVAARSARTTAVVSGAALLALGAFAATASSSGGLASDSATRFFSRGASPALGEGGPSGSSSPLWLAGHVTPGLDAEEATLGTQPSVSLHSWDPQHVNTLRFNPCHVDDGWSNAANWNTNNLKTDCSVDALQCEFCTWILAYDSEYRVNDIVTCLGPTFKVAADAVLTMDKFKGTLLQRLLATKPKTPQGEIAWQSNPFDEARSNFEWLANALKWEQCDAPGRDTLLVHIRAGDNLNDNFKNIPHIPLAIEQMKAYVRNRPYIKRIELSSVLHFGVPAPDEAFYRSNPMNDGVGNAYMMTNEALQRNGDILSHFYLAAKTTYRDVWFSSNNDPDKDMCRYSKACHFITASLTEQEMRTPGGVDQRLSFSELVRDLHARLRQCSDEQVAEVWGAEAQQALGQAENNAPGISAEKALDALHPGGEILRVQV